MAKLQENVSMFEALILFTLQILVICCVRNSLLALDPGQNAHDSALK